VDYTAVLTKLSNILVESRVNRITKGVPTEHLSFCYIFFYNRTATKNNTRYKITDDDGRREIAESKSGG
jgi:hypothetical protein